MRTLWIPSLLVAVGAFAQLPVEWHSYAAPDASFAVDFPGREPYTRKVVVGDRNPTPRSDYQTFADGNQFMIEVFESDRYAPERAAKLLRNYPNPGATGLRGRVVESSATSNGGYPGRAVRMEGTVNVKPGKVTILDRVFIANGRMYLATVYAGPGQALSPLAQHFLDSFRILK